jgi:hypothetical protein
MRGMGLDSIDARIITHLQEDGRRPYTTIARDLGISEASVRQRVARLLKRKVIQIVAASSPLDLGLLAAQIDIRVAGDKLQQAAAQIAALPEVDFVGICAGRFDLTSPSASSATTARPCSTSWSTASAPSPAFSRSRCCSCSRSSRTTTSGRRLPTSPNQEAEP